MCTMGMLGVYRGQKRALDFLELELQTGTNCSLDAGI